MISLFLDTSSKMMIVGIYNGTKQLYLKIEESNNQLSEKLLPAIKNAFDSTNLALSNIDRIYVVNGPGSFTGVRIGVAVAKTIAWALKKEIIPISELELLSSTDTDGKNALALIDARRDYVYAGMYDKDLNVLMKDSYITLEAVLSKIDKETMIISYDSFQIETVIPKYNIQMVIEKHKHDTPCNPHNLKPNYLKRTEAEEKIDSSGC